MKPTKKTKTEVQSIPNISDKMLEPQNKLLVVIVNRGFAEDVIEQSRLTGAMGATILHGRGSAGIGEHFMGMNITPEKEIVLIVIKDTLVAATMEAIATHSGTTTAAGGICFCVPVNHMTKIKGKQE